MTLTMMSLAPLDIKDAFLQVPQEEIVGVSLYGKELVIKHNLPLCQMHLTVGFTTSSWSTWMTCCLLEALMVLGAVGELIESNSSFGKYCDSGDSWVHLLSVNMIQKKAVYDLRFWHDDAWRESCASQVEEWNFMVDIRIGCASICKGLSGTFTGNFFGAATFLFVLDNLCLFCVFHLLVSTCHGVSSLQTLWFLHIHICCALLCCLTHQSQTNLVVRFPQTSSVHSCKTPISSNLCISISSSASWSTQGSGVGGGLFLCRLDQRFCPHGTLKPFHVLLPVVFVYNALFLFLLLHFHIYKPPNSLRNEHFFWWLVRPHRLRFEQGLIEVCTYEKPACQSFATWSVPAIVNCPMGRVFRVCSRFVRMKTAG